MKLLILFSHWICAGHKKSPLNASKWLMMDKTADEKEGPHWTVEEVLETIDEDIQSLKEEMTEAQFEQADKVWGEFLADMVGKLEKEKET